MLVLAVLAALCALFPALLFFRNLGLYRPPPASTEPAAVSVLIPARNEEGSIAAAVESALASRGLAELEVIVLDDGSADRTAGIVRGIGERDPRVRLESAPPLPPGWCGKVHACAVLARHARHPYLVFVDADVRLAPDGLARTAAFARSSGAPLVSGFPHQETGTWLEKLLIPLMHFVLLGFLPLERMRQSRHPAYGAACGQLLLAERAAYEQAGGHAAIHDQIHDGIELSRTFRQAGFATDLFDATGAATCRMYHRAGEVWNGLAKNATDGLGAPGKIVPVTLLFLLGQVAPFALLFAADSVWALSLAILACLAAWAPRFAAASRFRQPWLGAVLHPLAILVFLAIQWTALVRRLAGRPAVWKGRSYGPAA